MFLFFHKDLYRTGDPTTDFIISVIIFTILGIVLIIDSVSVYFGVSYLLKNWSVFARGWKQALIAVPAVVVVINAFLPSHLQLLYFPFGLAAEFVVSLMLNPVRPYTGSEFPIFLAGAVGITANIVGFIGVFALIEKGVTRWRKHQLP